MQADARVSPTSRTILVTTIRWRSLAAKHVLTGGLDELARIGLSGETTSRQVQTAASMPEEELTDSVCYCVYR